MARSCAIGQPWREPSARSVRLLTVQVLPRTARVAALGRAMIEALREVCPPMTKVAFVVLADTETREGLGRTVNAMIGTKEFKDAGDEVRLIFDGAATKWVGELAKPDHRYHELFEAVRDRVAVLAATARRPTAPNRTSTASRSPRWTRTSITRSCVGWWPRASRSSPSSRPGGTVRSHHLAEMVRTAPWAPPQRGGGMVRLAPRDAVLETTRGSASASRIWMSA